MKAFVHSVAAGSFAGAALPMCFTLVLALDGLVRGDGLLATLYLAILPLAVTTPVVLVAALIIGLPVSAFLRRANWESRIAYVSIGAVAGFVFPLLLPGLSDVLGLFRVDSAEVWPVGSLFGTGSGAVTGFIWSTYRQKPQPR